VFGLKVIILQTKRLNMTNEVTGTGHIPDIGESISTLEKEGKVVYEDITEKEVENLIENAAEAEEGINFVENHEHEQKEISERVPQKINRAQVEGDGRMGEEPRQFQRSLEASIRDAQEAQENLSERDIADISEALAKENNAWVDMRDLDTLGTPLSSGVENDVYIQDRTGFVYKVNNLSTSKGSIKTFIDRLNHTNKLFLSESYELVGFTGFGNGSVYPIVKQRFVSDATFATKEQIGDYMQSLGFDSTGKEGEYTNGEYVVSDARPRNVLVSKQGNVYVIDADVKKQNPPHRPIFRSREGGKERRKK